MTDPAWLEIKGRIPMSDAPWMDIARGEIGTEEPDSVKYFSATDYEDPEGDTPYCAAFCNWCLKQVGITGTRSAAAISWKNWGKDVSDTKPIGSIVVFTWSSGQNHVTFYSGAGNFLGGNQTSEHEVCEESLPLNRAVAWRWPKT